MTRSAIVTGGSRGIGRDVVIRLAADGFAVVAGYAGNKQLADDVVREVEESGGRAIAVQADVADENAVAAMFGAAEAEFGGVDVVAHAAGKMALSTIADLDLAVLDDVYRTNVRGTFAVAQQAARRVRDGGALITFSSSAVALAFPAYSPYTATKGAVEAMTMVLARELRGRDITVNTIAPGPTATDLFFEGKDQETVDRLAAQPPLQRLGTPPDIAAVTSFLAGPDGRWINGQILRANGGIN